MNNKKKKLILIIVMIISIIGIIVTVLCTKNNLSSPSFQSSEPMMEQNKEGAEVPDMPNEEFGNMENQPSNMEQMKDNIDWNTTQQTGSLSSMNIIIISVFATIFSLSLLYLLMSHKNEEFYKNRDKFIIYILANIILIECMIVSTVFLANNMTTNNTNSFPEEQVEKEEVELDESNVISSGEIDLSQETTDVTIKTGGTYIFSGNFTHSIVIDAEDSEVEIVLNGVEITNDKTATIVGLKASKIQITVADGTENILSDGGNSQYDGCIFSNAELVFDGTGSLIVNGNQNEGEGIATEAQNITFYDGIYQVISNDDGINAGGDGATITIHGGTFYIDASGDGIDSNKNAIINGGTIFVMGSDVGGDAGIDTDDGFVINGGVVVALGSDMIETPLTTSTQKTIAFTLNESISKGNIITLMKGEEEIVSFQASKSFKTIIISTNTLTDGDYTLYMGGSNSGVLNNGIYEDSSYTKGEKITIDNKDTYTVSKIINLFESSSR